MELLSCWECYGENSIIIGRDSTGEESKRNWAVICEFCAASLPLDPPILIAYDDSFVFT